MNMRLTKSPPYLTVMFANGDMRCDGMWRRTDGPAALCCLRWFRRGWKTLRDTAPVSASPSAQLLLQLLLQASTGAGGRLTCIVLALVGVNRDIVRAREVPHVHNDDALCSVQIVIGGREFYGSLANLEYAVGKRETQPSHNFNAHAQLHSSYLGGCGPCGGVGDAWWAGVVRGGHQP